MDPWEKDIIEGLQSGRESAYRQLFEMYYQQLVVFAYKYLQDLEAARDIVQECFLQIYESRRSISIHTSLKSYLFTAVRNRCLNQLKQKKVKEKYRNSIRSEVNISELDLEEMIEAVELEEAIYKVVAGLPERCKQIFTMSRVDGKKNHEIASELNLSIRTVETQISKALKSLKNKLLK